MSSHLSNGDTWKIWAWLKVSNLSFCWIKISCNWEINERSFSNPHTCLAFYETSHKYHQIAKLAKNLPNLLSETVELTLFLRAAYRICIKNQNTQSEQLVNGRRIKMKIWQFLMKVLLLVVPEITRLSFLKTLGAASDFNFIKMTFLFRQINRSISSTGIILCMCNATWLWGIGMCQANERWRYNVTSSLIGWAHAQNVACSIGYVLSGKPPNTTKRTFFCRWQAVCIAMCHNN